MLLGRDPVAGESLASQPTLSPFENAAGRGALYDMGCELAARVVDPRTPHPAGDQGSRKQMIDPVAEP